MGRQGLRMIAPTQHDEAPPRFDVYRTDERNVSSTRFCGGDWHWRLIDEAGCTLVDAGGYSTEGECLDAVTILQQRAGYATLRASA
jgi:uncharacterized protein YegP (UPF0339 family)